MSRRSVPSFADPRFMMDRSFIAMSGPGSETATINGSSPSVLITNPDAVEAAHAWD